MKLLCLRDKRIGDQEYNRWEAAFSSFIYDHVSIRPTFTTKVQNFVNYPTYIDSDGDVRPTEDYLATLGSEEYDHIFMFVHEDNWLSDPPGPNNGIWGTNYSYSLGDYHLHYCRWDRDNDANTFGTSYHEWMHGLDALIKIETGETINFDGHWDRCAVHGRCDGYSYIRYKENVEVLFPIKQQLQQAYKQREINRLKKKVGLLQTILLLVRKLKMLVNQKNGVPRGSSSPR